VTAAPPFTRVDHVVVAVRDLAEAERAYAAMLGLAPSWRGAHPAYGTRNVAFGLANCYLELLAPGDGEEPPHPLAAALRAYLARRREGLFAIALGTADLPAARAALAAAGRAPGDVAEGAAVSEGGDVRRWRSFALAGGAARRVNVLAIEHAGAGVAPAAPAGAAATVAAAVDHVVLFSDDLPGALGLWRDAFGIPERWRREIPERGTVNVGLRLGGVTLELVAPLGAGTGARGERLWGVAYAVADCDGAVARLRAHDVPVSDPRPGLAPGTRVATVKWADRVPTLLIEHTARSARRAAGAPPDRPG
jgi:catechol 2,3-dioxygenase-like lactoylglutathione lyase family enzyme